MGDKTREDLLARVYGSLVESDKPEFLCEIAMPTVHQPVDINESSNPSE